MKPPPFAYHTPTDVGEALSLLEQYGDEAKVIAGGQSLMPMLNFRLAAPEQDGEVGWASGAVGAPTTPPRCHRCADRRSRRRWGLPRLSAPGGRPLSGGPVVVVGGGIIGVSIAYHLAVRGYVDVAVVERGLVGEGATGKATGGIRQQFSSRINALISRDAVDYFERFEDLVGEPLDFRQHGYLFVTDSASILDAARPSVAFQGDVGIPVETVTPDEIGDLHPGIRTDDLVGGTYCPTDGSASPTDAINAFTRQARRLGVRVLQRTEVHDILRDADGGVRGVVTDHGELEAEAVINAAGPWASRIGEMVGMALAVEPHPRQAFAVADLPWLTASTPFTIDLESGAYLHPERSGAVIGGVDRSRPASYEETVDQALFDRLIEAIVHRFPRMSDATVLRGWVGLREMTPDDHALVGPSGDVPGFWVAAGFSGHGFMHAPIVGREMSTWLATGAPGMNLSALSPDRFAKGVTKTEPLVF